MPLPSFLRHLAPPLLALALLGSVPLGCSSGGGSSGPLAVTLEGAVELPRGALATGELDGLVAELYAFDATAGEALRIRLFATRLAQEAYDADCVIPYVSVLDPFANPALSHRPTWAWGPHDLDIPVFIPRFSGTHYLRIELGTAPGQSGAPTAPTPYGVVIDEAAVGPRVDEAEPRGSSGANDFLEDAQLIDPGFVHGHHVAGEIDIYAFEVNEPVLVYFEVTAYRNGTSEGNADYFDPALRLFDPDGEFLFYNEDAFFYDPAVSFLIDLPDTYFLEVASFLGDFSGDYLLRFETTPVGTLFESEANDTVATADPVLLGDVMSGVVDGDPDLFTFDGRAGDVVRLWFYNSANHLILDEPLDLRILGPDGVTPVPATDPEPEEGNLGVLRTVLTADGPHTVEVSGGISVTGPSAYSFQLELVEESVPESEPNDDVGQSTAFPPEGAAQGRIEATDDEDTFSFGASEGELVRFAILADRGFASDGFFELSAHGSTLAPGLEIHDGSFTLALTLWEPANLCVSGESITHGLATLEVAFIAPADGTYYLTVFSQFILTATDEAHYVLQRL